MKEEHSVFRYWHFAGWPKAGLMQRSLGVRVALSSGITHVLEFNAVQIPAWG